MNINKLNPWNWFKHEEEQDKKNNVPIKCNDQISAQHTFNNTMQLHQEIDRLFDDAFRGFTSINHSPLWDKIMDSDFTLTFRANVNISSSESSTPLPWKHRAWNKKIYRLKSRIASCFSKEINRKSTRKKTRTSIALNDTTEDLNECSLFLKIVMQMKSALP